MKRMLQSKTKRNSKDSFTETCKIVKSRDPKSANSSALQRNISPAHLLDTTQTYGLLGIKNNIL